ncbi:hypothetical protein ACQP2U_42820 (plasmid) [Nocardia sp. CA-084685]|uniref:hypothetical protein n=1 Tax=Nocardia sp. CA-084685 TaxID=3239970 RepID=UPI003D9955E3
MTVMSEIRPVLPGWTQLTVAVWARDPDDDHDDHPVLAAARAMAQIYQQWDGDEATEPDVDARCARFVSDVNLWTSGHGYNIERVGGLVTRVVKTLVFSQRWLRTETTQCESDLALPALADAWEELVEALESNRANQLGSGSHVRPRSPRSSTSASLNRGAVLSLVTSRAVNARGR